MKILAKHQQNASPQHILDALWDAYPEERVKDNTPRIEDTAHNERFQRLVLSIHRQLSHKKKITKRKIPARIQARVRARRSPTAERRATSDSGGDSGGDPEPDPEPQSRRSGQAVRFYKNALQVTDFAGLTIYLDRHNANTTLAIQAGAKGVTNPAGESAVIWPIYHPAEIFTKGQIVGVAYSTPATDRVSTRGKQFIDRRSGGVLFGSPDDTDTIYITADPQKALAIHGATGRPCLSLITSAGLKGISEAVARQIGDRKVVIVVDEKDQQAGETCGVQIRLTAPQVKVTVSIYEAWGDQFLDILTESAFITTEPPRPTNGVHDDFLATPDLSGGPLGPEPPPIENNVIPHMPWRARTDTVHSAPLQSLKEMRKEMERVLPDALQAAMAGKPVLIKTPPGGGKTTILERLLPITKNAKGRPVSVFWLGPTKEITAASCDRVGGWLWDGRQIEGMCDLPQVTGALMERGRSPHQNACLTCPHGKKPTGEADDTRCQFQKNLSEIGHVRRVFAQHGAGGRESTLYKFAEDPRDEFADRDLTIIDEAIQTDVTTEIQVVDIMAARSATMRIDDHISNLKAKNEKKRHFQKKTKGKPLEARYNDDDFRKAKEWAAAIAPHLEVLAGLVISSPKEAGLHAIEASHLDEFIKLGNKIPKAARSADATCLERVENIFGSEPVVPIAWIHTLARALKRGTAWVRVTPHGSHIVCTNPSDSWERFLTKGGVLLDASCLRDDEVRAAGGIVIDLKCEQPHLRIVQYGPRLHGRGGLQDPDRKEKEATGLLEAIGDDQDAVAITHKPLSKALNDERIRWWGTHRGHNDWKQKKRLILWGLPLLNPSEQALQYATHRAALSARGIHIEKWDGSTTREWVKTDTHEMIAAARLPSVADARDWLIRALNAEIMQGVGRLRAVQATSPLLVEIYGFLPIQGFGLRVNEIRLERSGRAYSKTNARAIVAQGVTDLGEARTRSKLQEYFKQHAGRGISKNEADALVADLKTQALESGMSLYEAARASCATCTRLLTAGHEPAQIAQSARELGGLPGVIAVADLLDQCRRAPGLQRAGP